MKCTSRLLFMALTGFACISDGQPADGWSLIRIDDMTLPRAAHQATVLPSGEVLICGGCTRDGCSVVTANCERHDPADGTFRPAASMVQARASHASVSLGNGRVLAIGGWTGSAASASLEIYEPQLDRWRQVGSMRQARTSPAVAVLANGQVLVAGGGLGRGGRFRSAELYDPVTEAFESLPDMAANHELATRLPDGRVLLSGGRDAKGQPSASAELFQPASARFTPISAMGQARVKHAAVLRTDGSVLIVAGSDGRGHASRLVSTEIFDPTTGRFGAGPALHQQRHKIRNAVVVLPSGEVVVLGGAERPEILPPSGDAFQVLTGGTGEDWMFATASVLEDGSILLAGGYDEQTRVTARAWSMRPVPGQSHGRGAIDGAAR